MNARSLFLIFTAVGSAALGSGLAMSAHWQSQGWQAELPSASLAIPADPVAGSNPGVPNSPPVQPIQIPAPAAAPVVVPVTQTSSAEELAQARLQLRRAIREHNIALLKSLLRAGSVQEVLKTLGSDQQAVVEPINLDNLDASAWSILERIVDYCNAAAPSSVGADVNAPSQPGNRSQQCF